LPPAREADAVLCRRAAGGDRGAFRLLVETHEKSLRAFLAQLAGPELGDELAQEVFLKAWQSLATFRGDAKFSSWLCAIGWRLFVDQRRREHSEGRKREAAARLAETVELPARRAARFGAGAGAARGGGTGGFGLVRGSRLVAWGSRRDIADPARHPQGDGAAGEAQMPRASEVTDMDDAELDTLLRAALAPPKGPADRGFVVKVERAVAEAEMYRRWRAGLRRQLATEALALGAVGASFAFVAQVAEVHDALAKAPELIWPALLALLLFWMLVRGRGDAWA
jgi:sigma-70-like protein